MSFRVVPFVPSWFGDIERSHSLFDQFFGQPLFEEDLLPALDYTRRLGRYPEGQLCPMRPTFDRTRSGLSRLTNDKNEFKVSLDVQQFKPEEINVKTDDKFVIIEGNHEERPDEHGYIKRHFVRRYMLPEGVKPEDVKCNLSSDGVLSVTAPKQPALEQGQNERVVPIEKSPHPAIQQGTAQQQAGGQK